MENVEKSPSRELTPQEIAVLPRRILEAVDRDHRGRWVEIASAVILSLATMSTAWCAYQATLWSGVQTFRRTDGHAAAEPLVGARALTEVPRVGLIHHRTFLGR